MKTAFFLLLLLIAFGVVGRIDYDCARIAEIAKADDALRAMEDHQRRLHIPSPTSPISIL